MNTHLVWQYFPLIIYHQIVSLFQQSLELCSFHQVQLFNLNEPYFRDVQHICFMIIHNSLF